MEFVWIEPGTFLMGTTEEEEERLRGRGVWDDWFENEYPAHQVTISKGFYLGKCEITQGQWEAVMGARPWSDQGYAHPHPEGPAVFISWEDVQEFARRLNEAAGEDLYRLPTEAEWEYACRAGTKGLWAFAEEAEKLGDYAWYYYNALNAGLDYPQPVGEKGPNPWGLHDMYGNVEEWVGDWFGAYPGGSQVDPAGPAREEVQVLARGVRGGGYWGYAQYTRSACRGYNSPLYRDGTVGARLVRTR
jgi:formylglycine-generating enzyme required for sulfatase activity